MAPFSTLFRRKCLRKFPASLWLPFGSFVIAFGTFLCQFLINLVSKPFLSAPETAELLQIIADILAEGIPTSKSTINILYVSTIVVVYLTPLPSGCTLLRLRTRIHIRRRLPTMCVAKQGQQAKRMDVKTLKRRFRNEGEMFESKKGARA